MKAMTRVRGSETPTSSAATSLSRINRMARPVRLAKRLAMKKNATPVTTIVISASHIVLTVSTDVWALKRLESQFGGVTAVGSCRPASPPVHEEKEFTIAVKATAKASGIPASSGQRSPEPQEQTHEGASDDGDQERHDDRRRRVVIRPYRHRERSDTHERAVAQRDLSRRARKEREPQQDNRHGGAN